MDGVSYITDHEAGTANQKLMNNYLYLPVGKHSVIMVEKEGDGTSINKTVKIQIVAQP